MREELIFHLSPEKKWKEYKSNATYTPPSLQEEGFIHCSTGPQVEQTANRLFNGEKKLLLVVINAALVDHEIRYEEDPDTGEHYPHIYGPLALGAVIDKIPLRPEDDGTFIISFTSD